MNEGKVSALDDVPHGSPPSNRPSGSGYSGLTLVLPPLKAVKALKKSGLKRAANGVHDDEPRQKVPRPVKLKPLKEVLSKLIFQMKKKDNYAFFLVPVDETKVTGYSDVIKNPMDLGTMATKVEKGRYRSLDEFADDFRLVISNAKTFNTPDSIYYSEAEKLEKWGVDHIMKAVPTVIEFETNWNLDAEHSEDNAPLNVDEDDGNAGTPMEVDGESRTGRSPSVISTQVQPARRGQRGSKKANNNITESIDAEGRLPGSKDGLGAFPPGSDWAQLMLRLKLKGKRYRTKKERIRMERGGPPFAADSSLDYPEMEDPFSVLSVFAPEPQSRPSLDPLYPPLPPPTPSDVLFPGPVNIQPNRPPPVVTSLQIPATGGRKRRHWHIARNLTGRGKAKDREEDEPEVAVQTSRDAHAIDHGSYASLVEQLAEEMRFKDVGTALGREDKLFAAIRSSMDVTSRHRGFDASSDDQQKDGYWSAEAINEADAYIRDVVYGGLDGFAYVRSLSEFLNYRLDNSPADQEQFTPALGKPLVRWVQENILDPLTDNRHALLRATSHSLYGAPPADPSSPLPDVSGQIARFREQYPRAARQLADLRALMEHQIDMAALLRTPDELFASEAVWAGTAFKRQLQEERERALVANAAEYLAFAIEELNAAESEAQAGDGGAGGMEGPEVLGYVLGYTADKILEINNAQRSGAAKAASGTDIVTDDREVKKEDNDEGEKVEDPGAVTGECQSQNAFVEASTDPEDPALRDLRLNLLALAKRAPLDKIARLPAHLVPEHIRHIVPMITS